MKEPGKVRERYDFSFDARQLGIVLMSAAAIAAIVFALGVSVGVQWERKKSDEMRTAMGVVRSAPKTQAAPRVPAAPPVLAPVTTAKAGHDKTAIHVEDTKAGSKAQKQEPPVSLTFPKVLTSNTKGTAPLMPEKKAAEGHARRYTIQAGAYNEKSAAKAKAEKLRKKGYEAKVYDAGGKKFEYKVRVGSYQTRAEAIAAAKKLQGSEKLSPYVTLEENQ